MASLKAIVMLAMIASMLLMESSTPVVDAARLPAVMAGSAVAARVMLQAAPENDDEDAGAEDDDDLQEFDQELVVLGH
ncbi:hypothetical protein Cni_G25739 [Canna indica]|uniref:Uncharacterized protein n=1 Tax=Canna indica TaxID=4628 RepID=A0AAQ3QPP4_9LILI|nr:hypothetical protein Cni_G25739 [Canna indica]